MLYRFVYNAIYGEQVRIYDVTLGRDGRGELEAVVLPGGITLGGFTLGDLAGQYNGARAETRIGFAEGRALQQAVAESGIDAPPPVGLRLRSDSFYWTVSTCVDGRFRFTAFEDPSPGFAALRFPAVLFRLDGTGVPINPPRPLEATGPFQPNTRFETGPYRRTGPRFEIQVGQNGIVK